MPQSSNPAPQPDPDSETAVPAAGPPLHSVYARDAGMAELIQLFVEDLAVRVQAMSAALKRGDLDKLVQLAHQIKGAAGGYGFASITEQAAVVEAVACQGPEAPAGEVAQAVEALTDLCRRATADPAPASAAGVDMHPPQSLPGAGARENAA